MASKRKRIPFKFKDAGEINLIDDLIEKQDLINVFVTAHNDNPKHVSILNSWKKYFMENKVPFAITSENVYSTKHKNYKEQLTLWKIMPY